VDYSIGKYSKANLDKLAEAKASGKTIVGTYCTYSPHEIIMAAGAIPIGLCSFRQEPIAAAEKVLPSNLCPLIKSSYGAAVTGSCPYFAASDYIVAETTCDGKKKMYELLGKIKPMVVLELPQRTGSSFELEVWVSELERLKAYLEENLDVEITSDKLRDAIKLMNRERTLRQQLCSFLKEDRLPISGLSLHTAMVAGNSPVDREAYIGELASLLAHLQECVANDWHVNQSGQPRILVTGCPTGQGSEKVLRLIEESGAFIVAQEACSGIKAFDTLVDEEKEPMIAIAERYLGIGCPVRTPDSARFELLDRLVKDFKPDGVVDLTWQGCQPYHVESYSIKQFLTDEYQIPMLPVVTDYSESDAEQIRTRLRAFVEMLESR
jgi:benzoyl-CoA reductase/2-hydroxyglutaryl-CoA dehydratase subunit BcrC/BadD/HgdB